MFLSCDLPPLEIEPGIFCIWGWAGWRVGMEV